ncbi:hypothetical protein HK096_006994 [Nowakowskiella sp. JEL0078]|nr:hypothetical protein HK096_006994 [Nowakowskiella sp. JEL0078]
MSTVTKPIGGAKNGKTRTITKGNFYPGEDVRKQLVRSKIHKPTRLRSSITPGTVLIVLSGRFRGKRVVFLKQLSSGLLLVTGPYKVNGVPLRRVSQAYVIATSTKIDLTAAKIPQINDEFFKADKDSKKKLNAAQRVALFSEKKEVQKIKNVISESRISAQKSVDEAIVKAINKTPLLSSYLSTSFSLSKGQLPHELKF